MKRFLLVAVSFFLFQLAAYGEPVSQSGCSAADSLRLESLYKETVAHRMEGNRLFYVKKLLDEARKAHCLYYEAEALMAYAQHYYSRNLDSLYYWSEQAYPALLGSERIDDFFRVKAWNIYASNKAKLFDCSLRLVDSLKLLAKKMDYPAGIDMADQALADLYVARGLDQEGINLYKEVLRHFEENDEPLIKQVNIIRQLMMFSIDSKERIEYIKKMEDIVKQCKRNSIESLSADLPVYILEYSVQRDYVVAYANLGMSEKVKPHLEASLKIAKDWNIDPDRIDLIQVQAIAFRALGDYARAEELYARLVKQAQESKSLKIYVQRLWDLTQVQLKGHQYEKAAKNIIAYVAASDSLNNEQFDSELAKVHALHNMDRLKLENTQMELKVSQANSRQWKYFSLIIILLLSCLLLAYVSHNRHRVSLEMKRAKDKAEEADHLKSTFLANMNHEIRTPLNAIVGFSQVLIGEEDPEERQMMADIIQRNNELLQRLIEDVLDISKIESNNMEFRYTDVDIAALVNDIYRMAALRMPEHVEAQVEISTSLTMKTDRSRLTQILTNFVNNAIKHIKSGFIRIGYAVEDGRVEFFVQDTGEGIPEDKLDKVFSRFVKLDDWSSGVGLGLAISKGLVDKLGGTIGVTSVYGQGSTFTVSFPLN